MVYVKKKGVFMWAKKYKEQKEDLLSVDVDSIYFLLSMTWIVYGQSIFQLNDQMKSRISINHAGSSFLKGKQISVNKKLHDIKEG